MVEFPPQTLKLGNLPRAVVPTNSKVKLDRLKFPQTFGVVKKILEDTLGCKIKDANIEGNKYKHNYGLRIVIKDTYIDFECVFTLSHTRENYKKNSKKAENKEETDQVFKEQTTNLVLM